MLRWASKGSNDPALGTPEAPTVSAWRPDCNRWSSGHLGQVSCNLLDAIRLEPCSAMLSAFFDLLLGRLHPRRSLACSKNGFDKCRGT